MIQMLTRRQNEISHIPAGGQQPSGLRKEHPLCQTVSLWPISPPAAPPPGAAKAIAQAVGGDLYEIRPAVPYTAADLDWTNKKSRSSVEMNDPACRPAIAAPVENMDQYDTVFLGFPIWWYVEPRIVDTFLESHALAGKRVIPFATSGGSGIDGATRSLQSHCPQAKWVQGQVLHGNPAAWAKRVLAG